MQQTTNYALKKIELNDSPPDITVINPNWDTIDQKLKELEESDTTHLADFEYQTPTVVGTQIRLSKQSETSRLFFKLDAKLSGNITISLDGGTTSKNLVDVDGKQITSLDKGFAEVVAYANFFILRNKGGLSKAGLEALITLTNAAERNEDGIRAGVASAISSNGVPASPTDTWVVLTDKINKYMGPEKVSGTATASSAGVVTVTGLPFKPSRIELKATANPNEIQTIYDETHSVGATLFFNIPNGNAGAKNIASVGGSVTATSFTLPFLNGNASPAPGTNYPIKWTAYRKKGG